MKSTKLDHHYSGYEYFDIADYQSGTIYYDYEYERQHVRSVGCYRVFGK